MRLTSFTTVAIRLMGLLSIFYGMLMVIFMFLTIYMFSGFGPEERFPSGMGSMLVIQFLLPGLMVVFGVILIVASRSLAGVISSGLED
jgi:hypothetical protein